MIEVRLSDTDSLERALKVFKKKLQKSGLLRELRRRRRARSRRPLPSAALGRRPTRRKPGNPAQRGQSQPKAPAVTRP